jgi:hypothetical protein
LTHPIIIQRRARTAFASFTLLSRFSLSDEPGIKPSFSFSSLNLIDDPIELYSHHPITHTVFTSRCGAFFHEAPSAFVTAYLRECTS